MQQPRRQSRATQKPAIARPRTAKPAPPSPPAPALGIRPRSRNPRTATYNVNFVTTAGPSSYSHSRVGAEGRGSTPTSQEQLLQRQPLLFAVLPFHGAVRHQPRSELQNAGAKRTSPTNRTQSNNRVTHPSASPPRQQPLDEVFINSATPVLQLRWIRASAGDLEVEVVEEHQRGYRDQTR